MGLGLGGLQGGGSSTAANVLAALVGQDIVARSISLSQLSGSVALQMVTGARLQLGTGSTDYFTSNGTTTITTPATLGAAALTATAQAALTMTFAGLTQILATNAAGRIQIRADATSANVSATAAGAAIILGVTNALDATDWVCTVNNSAISVLAITNAGSIVLPTTDSSGTPGAATINQACGRSAIAAGASSAVITNSLVTAASHIFISPGARDATGLLPIAVPAAGSFTLSTTANCTAALTIDWFVVT